MEFKSFTDFRRKLRVGQTFRCEHHQRPHLSGLRKIVRVQGNAISYEFDHPEKGTMVGWTHWPKASEIRVEGSRITFMDHGMPLRTREPVDLPSPQPLFTYDFAEVEEG